MARKTEADTYMVRFFEEKDIAHTTWTLEDSTGLTHIIGTEEVIDLIHKAPQAEKRAVRKMLVLIDFANAPVVPFLKHLAQGFINTQAGAL